MHSKLRGTLPLFQTTGHILIWLFFVYLYIEILGFRQARTTHPILNGMYFIQFGVHEVSHLLTIFLPPIFMATAGSVGEISFTALIVVAAIRAKSHWAMVFGLLWVMLAMISVGNYMVDARAQAMPLAGIGPDPIHDWHFIFSELGWLNAAEKIGSAVRAVGAAIGGGALLFGLVLLVKSRPAIRGAASDILNA